MGPVIAVQYIKTPIRAVFLLEPLAVPCFDLPVVLVDSGDREGTEREMVGKKDDALLLPFVPHLLKE